MLCTVHTPTKHVNSTALCTANDKQHSIINPPATVKLRYNGLLETSLKGPSYPKSVISKLDCGRLTRVGIFTVQLHCPPDSLHNRLPSPRQWLSVSVCYRQEIA